MKPISQLDLSLKKVIIFDFDGTLADSIEMWNRADQQLIKHFSGMVIDLETIQEQQIMFIADYSGDDLYPSYCDFLNKQYNFNSTKTEVWDWYVRNIKRHLTEMLDYKPYAQETLRTIKSKGFKIALATNSPRQVLDALRDNKNFGTEFGNFFDLTVTASDVKKRKPAPDIYNQVLEHFGVTADQCITFEDAVEGTKSAKAAGIEVINVYDQHADLDRDEINKLADFKINSFEEVLSLL